jgi:hypothetical protein
MKQGAIEATSSRKVKLSMVKTRSGSKNNWSGSPLATAFKLSNASARSMGKKDSCPPALCPLRGFVRLTVRPGLADVLWTDVSLPFISTEAVILLLDDEVVVGLPGSLQTVSRISHVSWCRLPMVETINEVETK